MKKRSYKITFDLKEGYKKNGQKHSSKQAAAIIKKWMEERLEHKRPVVNGMLQEGMLFYPSKEPGQENNISVVDSAIFSGELSPEDKDRKDREIRNTLESLAFALKSGLKQKTVFIIYRDRNWNI